MKALTAFLGTIALVVGGQVSVAAKDTVNLGNDRAQLYMGDTPMITTYGQGTANAPADTAQLFVTLTNINPNIIPDEDYEPVPLTEATLEPIFNTLAELGIDRSDIDFDVQTYQGYGYPQSTANFTIDLDRPTQNRIDTITETLQDTAEASDNFFWNNSYSQCTIEDMRSLQNEARLAAIADVRDRVDAMASAAGGRVGTLLNAIEVHSYLPLSTSCSPPGDLDSPGGIPEVSIEQWILMTFSLVQ